MFGVNWVNPGKISKPDFFSQAHYTGALAHVTGLLLNVHFKLKNLGMKPMKSEGVGYLFFHDLLWARCEIAIAAHGCYCA